MEELKKLDTFTVGSIVMSSDTKEIFSALAKAQAKIEPVHKDRTADAGKYSYNYATLDAVWDAVRPALTENDICTIQSPCADGDDVSVTTMLGHSSGQWIAGTITLRALGKTDKQGNVLPVDAQSVGSCVSYGRRYTLMAIVGVTPDEDDDGSGGNVTTKPKSGPSQISCPECGKYGTIIKGKEEYGGGWLCYDKKGGCGMKWQTNPSELEKPPAGPAEEPEPPVNELSKVVDEMLKVIGCKNADDAVAVLTWATAGEYTDPKQYRATKDDSKSVHDMIQAKAADVPLAEMLDAARKTEETVL